MTDTLKAWNELGGETVYEWYGLDQDGKVRIVVKADQEVYDDSYLDTWGLPEDELARERNDLRNRIQAEGTCGIVSEFWNGAEWVETYSCWGFIGDDWEDSGYDQDAMRAAIDGYNEHLTAQARILEATRPDMYA